MAMQCGQSDDRGLKFVDLGPIMVERMVPGKGLAFIHHGDVVLAKRMTRNVLENAHVCGGREIFVRR
jgi:hypothetical protein